MALVAAFTQGVLGFGFGLVAMALVPWLTGFRYAVALVAVFGLAISATLLFRYRLHVRRAAAGPLIVGAVVGAPLGVLVLQHADATVALRILGVLVAGYALQQLTARRDTRDEQLRVTAHPLGYLAGFAGGALGTAFNTGGPPAIAYASWRRWAPLCFKANLQAMFVTVVLIQLPLIAWAGILTSEVLTTSAVISPAILGGLYAGARYSETLDGPTFQRLVLLALLVLGVAYIVK